VRERQRERKIYSVNSFPLNRKIKRERKKKDRRGERKGKDRERERRKGKDR
jgi:hypothetical protein